MVGFPFEEGVLTPLENDRLNTAFGIIRGVIQDSVESSIELGFNAKKRCHFCGKPVVEGSEYCREHKEYEVFKVVVKLHGLNNGYLKTLNIE